MSKTFTIKAVQQVAKHRPEGYLEEVFSSGTVEGEKVTLTDEAYRILVAKYRAPVRPGVGTELKALLSKVGITASPTCSCNTKAEIMNRQGISWCEENVETICDWLQEEATKRKLPFVRLAGKALIHVAIRRAKRGTNK
jgi:hypothetical protein